jgi:hypothetical protein
MNKTQKSVIDWLANSESTERSSEAMAYFLAFGTIRKDTASSCPRSFADFDSCIALLDAAPGLRRQLVDLSSLSKEWARLVLAWDRAEKTYRAELDLTKYDRPARGTTHSLIKKIVLGRNA